jgi:hypothetical protein
MIKSVKEPGFARTCIVNLGPSTTLLIDWKLYDEALEPSDQNIFPRYPAYEWVFQKNPAYAIPC